MGSSEDAAAALGAAHDGVVVADVLGVSEQAVGRLRRRGVLVRLGVGVSKLRDHPWDWRCQARAAIELARPGGALGLRAAARLHGFYRYRNESVIEIVVPRGQQRRRTHARLVQTRSLPDEHVTVIDGLRCTTIARTFFDLCGDPDGGRPVAHPAHVRRMARVYNDAVGRRGLQFVHEVAVLSVLARRGRGGTVLVRELLDRYGADFEPTRSETESLFMELVDAYGFRAPEKQVPMSDEFGWIGTVDFYWAEARLVVEVDSAWHDGPIDQDEDAERDGRLRRAGYKVKRYRYRHLALRPDKVATELGSILFGKPNETDPNS